MVSEVSAADKQPLQTSAAVSGRGSMLRREEADGEADEAGHAGRSSEEPGSDGERAQAEASKPEEISLTRETGTVRRKRLKNLESETREETRTRRQ